MPVVNVERVFIFQFPFVFNGGTHAFYLKDKRKWSDICQSDSKSKCSKESVA